MKLMHQQPGTKLQIFRGHFLYFWLQKTRHPRLNMTVAYREQTVIPKQERLKAKIDIIYLTHNL
jgi:hypothetical protein